MSLIDLPTEKGWPAWMSRHLASVDPHTSLVEDAAGVPEPADEPTYQPSRSRRVRVSSNEQVDEAFSRGLFQLNDRGPEI